MLKRRHLSVKRRQLLLCDCVGGGVRLFYVDADRKMELKGTVPWSDEINAELMVTLTRTLTLSMLINAELNAELDAKLNANPNPNPNPNQPRGCFRITVPGRTYYLEDAQGSAETAELWVRTLLKMRARLSGASGGDVAQAPPRNANGPTREPGSRRGSAAPLGFLQGL